MTPALRARAALPLALVTAVAVVTSAGLWRALPVYGHSIDLDPFRVVAFDAALRSGDWLPRWTPWWYHGHGSPLFHFYAPLPYYATELWLLAGAGVARALQLTLFASWLLSGVTLFLLARDALSRPAATVAAVLYLLAPYHLVDMLVRHALGEHLAFAWIPLAIWGVAGSVERASPARFSLGALGVAALPLTHNLTALMALPLVVAWAALAFARTRSRSGAVRAALALLLGLAISAFFWLPALADLPLVPARERLTSEYYRYALHFVEAHQLFVPAWGFGGSVEGAGDGMSFQIGVVHWLLVAIGSAALAARVVRPRSQVTDAVLWLGLAALATLAAAALMTTTATRALWDALPPLAFVQFPWRFLTLAALGASLAGGCAIDALSTAPRRRVLTAAAAIACAVLAYAPYARPHFALFDRESGEIVHAPYAEARAFLADGSRYEDAAARASLDTLVASGQAGASRHEYLPAAVSRPPLAAPTARAELLGGGHVERAETLGPNHERFTLALAEPDVLRFRQFAFPGWRATLDGTPLALRIEPGSGLLLADVPAGPHQVAFEFGSTPLRRAAAACSLLALGALLLLAKSPLVLGRS